MALQSSGAISLDDIHQEAGGSADSNCSINDADIRGLISVSAGATMSFDDWYGASAVTPRTLFMGGVNSDFDAQNIVDFINIASAGNVSDFGDIHDPFGNSLNSTKANLGECASSTRALHSGGSTSGNAGSNNSIRHFTFASTGNSSDFGDMSGSIMMHASASSATRGITNAGGRYNNAINNNRIEYVTIGSTGNTTDFGDLTGAANDFAGSGGKTRSMFIGNKENGFNRTNEVEFITIGSTGNATDFGNMSGSSFDQPGGGCAASSNTRLIYGAYTNPGTASDTLDRLEFFTIASTGNGSSFGDLAQATIGRVAASNSTKAVWAGGSNYTNVIEFVTIASTGNASDFGDLGSAVGFRSSASSQHGGL